MGECSTSGRGLAVGDYDARGWRSGQLRAASHARLGRRWQKTLAAAVQSAPDARPLFGLGTSRPEGQPPYRSGLQVPKEQVSLKAHVIFDASWKKMEEKWRGRYLCPREIVWLNGAPGSGKGTNMPFIMKSRGLSRALGMSQLLDSSPEIKAIIEKGELVPDQLVLDALLEAVLNPDVNDGAGLVIDGFPRTAIQVDFVKLLYDKLTALSLKHVDTSDEWRFPRPSFKVTVLYVDEEESVRRQMRRAQLASLHNKRVMDAGTGDVWDVRTTDVNEMLCRRRYQVFKAHYHTILRLKQHFPFSLIDAMGTLEECREQIMRELRYQSSLDLDEQTYAAIRHLPLARDLVRVARQRLVFRLDSYCKRNNKTFTEVIKLIGTEVMPVLKQCSLAGHAEFQSQSPLLLSSPAAVDILVDVLSDRGFSVAHSREQRMVPQRVDLVTGAISCRAEMVHKFRITFDKENVRDLSTPTSVTTKQGEDVAIGTTFIPSHMIREDDRRIQETTIRTPHGKSAREREAAATSGIADRAPPPQQQQQAPQLLHAAAHTAASAGLGEAAAALAGVPASATVSASGTQRGVATQQVGQAVLAAASQETSFVGGSAASAAPTGRVEGYGYHNIEDLLRAMTERED